MKLSKAINIATVSALTLITLLSATPVSATALFNSTLHYDDFAHLYLKPNPHAGWWINNFLGGSRFEDWCSPGHQSCVSRVEENEERFARLTFSPSVEASNSFVEAAVSELRTYVVSGPTGIWSPSVGHPITVEAEVRWSEGYEKDASGDAVGTSGFWLWNSPYSPQNPNAISEESAIGFTWTGKGTAFGLLEGLRAVVVYNSLPIAIDVPVLPLDLDINNWNTYKIVWSVNVLGLQTVEFYINNSLVGIHALPVAFAPLSINIWNDNQFVQYDANGLNITYKNPVRDQSIDINSISIRVN